MRFNSRTLGLLSILFFLAAIWFWLRGNEEVAKRQAAKQIGASKIPPQTPAGTNAGNPQPTGTVAPRSGATSSAPANAVAPATHDGFPYRLRNTAKSIDELGRVNTAILLDNAFIDTSIPGQLEIPEHLRANGDSGSYIVQASGLIDPAFYSRLRDAGAEFVSYIPNNACLVRATAEQAAQLADSPQIQAVLKYQPYFKLAESLLPLAVEKQSLPNDQMLNVVLFPGQHDPASVAIKDLGGTIVAEDRSPFGPILTVQPDPDSLPALAALSEVQRIEPSSSRVALNDLTRVRLSVSPDSVTPASYLDLKGDGVMININDTGVDAAQPDLAGRVSSTDTNWLTLRDFDGHGTHVAGILASSGASSSTVVGADGSVPGADFRGKAPKANLFVLPIDLLTGPLLSDTYLQETAARGNYISGAKTDPMISNNSWGYPGAFQYNSASASYDEAVRDALPGVPGSQPLLYVFAAGNSGFGSTNGVVGVAGSILAPANAKNVIAVGALESPRGLTNELFAGYTDSDNEVAAFSSRGNVGIGTEGVFGRFKPDVIAPGTFIVSTRSENAPADPIFDLGPLYRYDSGTSMAAPAVSGLLALMQEFFEQQLHQGFSPALFKALLINGSRSVNQNYDLQVRKSLNIQGWGLVNLTNSLPSALTNQTDETQWPIRFVDQSPTNVLTTGQSHTWNVALSPDAQSLPLRATLVWTDPPGNPGAAIKLVNDLDLIVTNLDTGEVFLGNDIPAGADFTSPVGTNPSANDFVNNVENVFLKGPLGTNYSITVVGRRVNVNAVTADTTGIVQDYALVVSSGNGEVPDAFQSWTREATPQFTPPVIPITNGVTTMRQRVGANFQLTPSPDGTPAQWTFFVFTNAFATNNFPGMTNGSNVAFITFLPPNAARPRNLDADIDLYVSRDPQLTNLSPAVLSAPSTSKSLHRGGTESVVFTNAPVGPDVVYYVGVKSEDQQAAEFGIIALSTDLPFDSVGPNGSRVLHGYPANVPIPDGSPQAPGGALVFAIGVEPVIVGHLTVAEQITHQSIGDLLGNLSHQDQFAVLNNHVKVTDPLQTVFSFFYDDSGGGQFFNSQPTDGPGSLNNFVGQAANGVWLLTMTDDSSGRTGVVNNLTITIAPQQFTASGADLADVVLGNQWRYYAVDIPADASTLTVLVSQMSGPLNVYLRHGDPPTTTDYDKSALLTPPGGAISLGLGDVPPLTPGICWIGVFNPTAVAATYHVAATIGYSLAPSNTGQAYSGDTPLTILDDAVTTSSLFVPSGRSVVDVRVGVRIDHPRASDLALHLTNPQGARTLLAENRGGESTAGYGATLTTTNVFPRTSSGGPEEDRNVIGTGLTSGQIKIDYDFFTVPDDLRVYYEGVLLFDTGETNGSGSVSVNFGPGLSTNVTIVVNEGGSTNLTTEWTYTASVVQEQTLYTTFTDSTNLADVPIKFAIPPFTNSLIGTTRTNQTILIDGFEHATNGTYPVGSYVSGWRVSYGSAVVHGTNNPLGILPDSGTNFVELIEPGSPGSPSGVLTNITVTPGRPYRMSFAYNRNPRTPANQQNVVAVYTNGVLGQFVFIQTPGWQTATYDFKTSSGSINLEIRSASAAGALIDSVSVAEHAEQENRFFFPEEPLQPLTGSPALGKWSLEVEDNRVGPSVASSPKLVSWELEFTFANTNLPAVTLTNCTPTNKVFCVYQTNSCVPFTNTVTRDEIKYFIVEVPRSATLATNVLSGTGDLVLLFSQTGLPTGTQPGDVVVNNFFAPGAGEVLILNTNSPPQLEPGQRYYLGVANANPAAINTFTLCTAFDRIDASLINVIALTNAIPYTRTIGVTNAIDYYQFTVSSNATSVQFDLVPVNGNVDLVVRKALPILDPLPTPNPGNPVKYDYISENTGTNADQIIVDTLSQPVPIEPGVWYLGVYNVDVVPVTYSITATEGTNATTGRNVIPLTNGIPVNLTIAAGSALTNFFSFNVTDTNSAVLFELYNLSDNADLLLDLGNYPSPGVYLAADSGTPALPAQIVIRTNASIPSINGGWYLAVDNVQNVNLSFSIRAVVSTNGILQSGVPLTFTVQPSSPPLTGLDLSWYSVSGETYSIETSKDLVTWTLLDTVVASGSTTTYNDPAGLSQPILFYRIRQVP